MLENMFCFLFKDNFDMEISFNNIYFLIKHIKTPSTIIKYSWESGNK